MYSMQRIHPLEPSWLAWMRAWEKPENNACALLCSLPHSTESWTNHAQYWTGGTNDTVTFPFGDTNITALRFINYLMSSYTHTHTATQTAPSNILKWEKKKKKKKKLKKKERKYCSMSSIWPINRKSKICFVWEKYFFCSLLCRSSECTSVRCVRTVGKIQFVDADDG